LVIVVAGSLAYLKYDWIISHRKELLLLIFTFCFTLLLLLVVLEVKLRMDYAKFHEEVRLKGESGTFCVVSSDDPELIYSLEPSACGYNSQGFFDYEHTFQKEDDIFRIIVIGDSVAYGWGVDTLNESFARVLERNLNDGAVNKTYEVIVLAVPGYSSSQELELLDTQAKKYDPDLIIWSYVLNDPAYSMFHDSDGQLGRYFSRYPLRLMHFFSEKWFFFQEERKAQSCSVEDRYDYYKRLHCVYWSDVNQTFIHLEEFSREENVPIIFMINPLFDPKGVEEYSYSSLHTKLADQATADGLLVVDLMDKYKNYDFDDLRLDIDFYDPWHPNAKGHRIIADYLSEIIEGHYE
ncbi:MAG: SGNH/GDSL hydrolase family protein, partial [Nanoarchaeota archaeon]|nr:SGNH/GDSL hydrolase family protein [Nanoarchaeota archaeon]